MANGRKGYQLLASIRDSIFKHLPADAVVTRIEFEGPEIAVYVKNPTAILEQAGLIKSIAKTIKKRIVIRTDPSVRKPHEIAKRIVEAMTPPEAEISEISFDDVLGEMWIRAKKPGYVIGKDGSLLRRILIETGWRPVILRSPPIRSRIVEGVMKQLLKESVERRRILRGVGERIHRDVVFENNYVRITALGAFKEVGRSAILVETAESRVLLDLGINPGGTDPATAFPRIDIPALRPDTLDAVVITHAHLDHCGLVPLLFKYGYEGPVYVTRATRDIMLLVQQDFLEVTGREGGIAPYTSREIRKMLLHTIPLDYEEVTDIAPDIRLTFYNAGHILGSAMVHLHIGRGLHNILYTGDFKYSRTKLLNRAHDTFLRVETLIMESTYGATLQPSREEAERQLITTVRRTIERGGKVLIPVMAVGRAQEIMIILSDAMKNKIIPEVPIYLDGMLDEVTAIHTMYPELLSREIRTRIMQENENPFTFEAFRRVHDRDERAEIAHGEPSIILATSGMLTGGPSVEYLRLLAEDPRNSLIFVSYQVKGTLGRSIKDGMREIQLLNPEGHLEIVKINMEVHSIEGFSGHSDKRELLSFLARMQPKPRRIILNHGEVESVEALAASISRMRQKLGLPYNLEILTPNVLDSIKLA